MSTIARHHLHILDPELELRLKVFSLSNKLLIKYNSVRLSYTTCCITKREIHFTYVRKWINRVCDSPRRALSMINVCKLPLLLVYPLATSSSSSSQLPLLSRLGLNHKQYSTHTPMDVSSLNTYTQIYLSTIPRIPTQTSRNDRKLLGRRSTVRRFIYWMKLRSEAQSQLKGAL